MHNKVMASAAAFSITEFRAPVRTAADGCSVPHVPQRPHEIHMARILTLLGLRIGQLRAPSMVDRVAALHEHIEHGPLAALGSLAVVVQVVAVARGGQE